ncbi:hypothetical protein BN159_1727 [Streptomyces davaonensis JCM 4913]|uniref:Uncharacterized protein n=1 Tax=Streptomyces davaonensis (strain DSM 101723 / JCM 4913 / KCC S-0913 / 768) TaxID=1214101 RepID=K4QTB4_STRDJ|nr:hypothetical protein BN159_1727 [Streptomyces davaonensis JCM 4913]
MPGGGRRAAPGVGDHAGGDAVHGGAQGGRDGVVDGGGDQRVDELQVALLRRGRRRVGGGENTGGAQEFGAADRVVAAHGGELGDLVDGDPGAEDGGRPGEPGGLDAESLQAGDETAPAGRAVQGAQFGRGGLDRFHLAVLHLGEQLDGLVGIARGDGPDLAAERGVGVPAEGRAGEARGGVRGQRAQRGDGAARRGGHRVEVAGALAAYVAGPAGHHDQHGQVGEALGEGGEPAQGLLVGPVGVVDEQHQRPVAPCEPSYGRHQAVAHALRVGAAIAGVRYAEGGARDVVPVAEVLAGLLGQQGHQRGLEQVPYHVEGNGLQGLAAAGRPHVAAARLGDPSRFGQQGSLAEAGFAPDDQQASRGGPVGAEGVHRPSHGGDFGLALPQGSRGGRCGPYLRHPATSPSRPNDVQASSVVLRPHGWRAVRGAVAVTGDGVFGKMTTGPAGRVRSPLIRLSPMPHTVGA